MLHAHDSRLSICLSLRSLSFCLFPPPKLAVSRPLFVVPPESMDALAIPWQRHMSTIYVNGLPSYLLSAPLLSAYF